MWNGGCNLFEHVERITTRGLWTPFITFSEKMSRIFLNFTYIAVAPLLILFNFAETSKSNHFDSDHFWRLETNQQTIKWMFRHIRSCSTFPALINEMENNKTLIMDLSGAVTEDVKATLDSSTILGVEMDHLNWFANPHATGAMVQVTNSAESRPRPFYFESLVFIFLQLQYDDAGRWQKRRRIMYACWFLSHL